jgi:two-component system phosphate regulon sensor histidine kinase PhoR
VPRRLLPRILFPLFLVWILCALLAGGVLLWRLRGEAQQQAVLLLETTTRDLSATLRIVGPSEGPTLRQILRRLELPPEVRVACLDAEGRPLASTEDATMARTLADRPEVRRALAGSLGWDVRKEIPAGRSRVYLARPHPSGAGPPGVAVIHASVALEAAQRRLLDAWWAVLAFGVALLLVGLGASVAATAWATRPVRQLSRRARSHVAAPASRWPAPAARILEVRVLEYAIWALTTRSEKAEREAREASARLQSLLDVSPDPVMVLDREGIVRALNQAACRLFDLDPGRCLGRDPRELTHEAALHGFIRDAMGAPEGCSRVLEIPGDPPTVLEARAVPVRGPETGPLGVLLLLRDVSDVARLERVRRDLVANAAHELKTPLTAIRGYAEAVLEGLQDPPAQQRYLGRILAQVDRLTALVDDMLLLAQLEGRGLPEARAEVALREVLELAAETVEGEARRRGVPLEIECDPGLRVRANGPWLERAVVNLLENALRYSPPGKVVRLRGGRRPGEVWIEVADEGPGIHPRHLPRVFERFYRADPSRDRREGGSGLGLAIVKHVAEAHGGRAEIASEPGRGTRVRIVLPAP